MTIQKRFIAGAVCPRCGELDRLLIFKEKDNTFKECVSCGFQEKQSVHLEVDELDTRVNHAPEQIAEKDSVVQVVNVTEMTPSKK